MVKRFNGFHFITVVLPLVIMALFSSGVKAMTPLELLTMLDEARKNNSFIGTFIHRRGDSVNSYHIVHAIEKGVQYERLKSLDGAPREVIRDGESVTCIHPEGVGSRWNQVPPLSPLVPGENIDWKELQGWLQYSILTHSRIAGRKAIVVEVQPLQNDRFVRRYGIDAETGLLLKTEILNAEGHSLELAQFTQVQVNPQDITDQLQPTLKGKVTRFDRKHWSTAKVALSNWQPHWLPTGFRLTGKSEGNEANEFVEAYTYSDGLSSFSLFREQLSDHFVEMEGHGVGATVAVSRIVDMQEDDNWGVTLVGEIPVETARKVAASVAISK